MSKEKKLPFIYKIILSVLSLDEDFEQFCGDLEESYLFEHKKNGKIKAHRFVLFQLLKSVPGLISASLIMGATMIRNYLKISVRNIFKNKLYSSINIMGFAIGLSAAVLTFLFVSSEMDVNKQFDDLEHIYKINTEVNVNGNLEQWGGTPPPLKKVLLDNYPEIEEAAVICRSYDLYLFRYESKKAVENIKFGEFSYFNIFSHKIIYGEIPSNYDISSVIIDDNVSRKYFGNENPVGKTIIIDEKYSLKVAAVFESMSDKMISSFQILVPFELINQAWFKNTTTNWANYNFVTFIKTKENFDLAGFNQKIKDEINNHQADTDTRPFLYPFQDIYLYEYGNIENVKIYSIITILLLLIASVNYINLASAQSIKRAREVGIRKVVGAKKKQIVTQFFYESLLITLTAVFISAIIVALVFPYWSKLNNMDVELVNVIFDIKTLSVIGVIILAITIVSCIYPAFIISSFLPAKVLKGEFKSSNSGRMIRKSLVFSQFVISVILVIVTLVYSKQINYMKNKDLGINKESVFYISLDGNLRAKSDLLKSEILKISGVVNATLSSHIPGSGYYWANMDFSWDGKPVDSDIQVYENSFDENFIDTYNLKLIEGEKINESVEFRNKVYINETFANLINVESVVGQILYLYNKEYSIVGIVNDFHHSSLRRKIPPYVYYTDSGRMKFNNISVKFEKERLSEILKKCELIVKVFESEYPFNYKFNDEVFARRYLAEEKLQLTVQAFGIIAILISCMGLLGMVSYSVNEKHKEIGVRKILGASIFQIMHMLLKEYTKIVILANIVAWPIAYYYLSGWLDSFAYKYSLSIQIFIIGGALALLIAILTVGGQAYKASVSNPIKAIKTE